LQDNPNANAANGTSIPVRIFEVRVGANSGTAMT
jgi:hypothetical protein